MKQLVIILLLMAGCVSPYPTANPNAKKYDYSYSMEGVAPGADMIYEDSILHVGFVIGPKEISFVMKNKSTQPLRILWDETSFITGGEAKRIMHAGVKYSERNNAQPPTLIPPGAAIDDLVAPVDNVIYLSGWITRPLFPGGDAGRADLREEILGLSGHPFAVFMPVQQGDKTHNYHWKFKIEEVIER
jgi:hypothetical protein